MIEFQCIDQFSVQHFFQWLVAIDQFVADPSHHVMLLTSLNIAVQTGKCKQHGQKNRDPRSCFLFITKRCSTSIGRATSLNTIYSG